MSKEHYEANDTAYASQILKQKVSGADTWLLLTTPTPTVKALLQAKALNWKPDTIIINSVSASDAVMKAAEERVGKEYTNGAISDSYLKNPPNPAYASDRYVKHYRNIAKRVCAGCRREQRHLLLRRREGARHGAAALQGREEPDACARSCARRGT